MNKKVQYLLPAEMIDMGGFPVKQALPTLKVEQVDPFLLLHHGQVKPLANVPANAQGVGPHPHRGFSPVTFVIEGEVHHRDSRGNNQIAKSGEVQWMHAGMGIIHSERPSERMVNEHGRQEIAQLWINTPASKKMDQPSYQYIQEADIPKFKSGDEKITCKLIAGEYAGQKGKIKTESPLLVIWGNGQEGGKDKFSIPLGFNSCLYLIRGKVRVEGYGLVEKENLMAFEMEGDAIEIELTKESQFLLLCGEPLNEELVQHGPFVMNTQTEIMEAMRDYQMGKMGFLVEEDL